MDGIPSPNRDFPQQIKNVTGNAYEKIQNKNLFDNSITPEHFYYNNSGTKTYNSINNFINEEIIKKDSYTISYKEKTGTVYVRFCEYDNEDNFIKRTLLSDNNSTISIDSSTEKVIISADKGVQGYFDELQIEQGTTATSYVPHEEQNYSFTFEEGQFLADNEKLQDNGMYKKWKQVTFSGTTATLLDAKTNGAYYCNKKIAGNLVGQTLTFDEEVTNAIIQYELAEPTTIPYNSTQASQYNLIEKEKAYNDITHISSTSDEEGFIMSIEALKKLED